MTALRDAIAPALLRWAHAKWQPFAEAFGLPCADGPRDYYDPALADKVAAATGDLKRALLAAQPEWGSPLRCAAEKVDLIGDAFSFLEELGEDDLPVADVLALVRHYRAALAAAEIDMGCEIAIDEAVTAVLSAMPDLCSPARDRAVATFAPSGRRRDGRSVLGSLLDAVVDLEARP